MKWKTGRQRAKNSSFTLLQTFSDYFKPPSPAAAVCVVMLCRFIFQTSEITTLNQAPNVIWGFILLLARRLLYSRTTTYTLILYEYINQQRLTELVYEMWAHSVYNDNFARIWIWIDFIVRLPQKFTFKQNNMNEL